MVMLRDSPLPAVLLATLSVARACCASWNFTNKSENNKQLTVEFTFKFLYRVSTRQWSPAYHCTIASKINGTQKGARLSEKQ